jgi:hypothetical protein
VALKIVPEDRSFQSTHATHRPHVVHAIFPSGSDLLGTVIGDKDMFNALIGLCEIEKDQIISVTLAGETPPLAFVDFL